MKHFIKTVSESFQTFAANVEIFFWTPSDLPFTTRARLFFFGGAF